MDNVLPRLLGQPHRGEGVRPNGECIRGVNALSEAVSYERMCGTVASLLFLFAGIETEAREIIAKAGGPESVSKLFGARGTLRAWRDLILQDRERRPEEALLAERLWLQH